MGMLNKKQIKEKHKEVLRKVVPMEHEVGFEPNKGNLLSNVILTKGMTCDTCQDNDTCKFAFDPYNTEGDCLALK
jgi:hypothetical protein